MCVKCKFLDIFFSDTSQHVNVFPYSVFYVFYEQYLTMVEDTAISLSISLGAVFIVTFALGGLDIKTAIVTSFTIILILVNLYFFNHQNIAYWTFKGNFLWQESFKNIS